MPRERARKVLARLGELKLDAFLVTHLPNVRYLTGFSGTNGICFVTGGKSTFLTDFRYEEQSHQEVKDFRIAIAKGDLFEELEKRKLLQRLGRVGVEGNYLPYLEFLKLKRKFPRAKLVPLADLVESIARIKDKEEIALIKKAAAISDQVFENVLKILRPGIRELDVSAEISYLHKSLGAEKDAFDPIVASGSRGALPHGIASERKIRKGEFVTLDFGCIYRGYCCDLTRTVAVGKPKKKLRDIYHIVYEAQRKAIRAAKSGMLAKELDSVARSHIVKKGYGKFFGHSLGHGIGLQVHEPPRISWQSSYRLQQGNVITIEPGIYIPGIGGVRIEDDVVVTNGRSRVLNKAPKELVIL